jgi:erythromycin esterase
MSVRLSDDAVHPLLTLDPAAADDDLAWLDEAVGDARVVAIGESAHYNGEFARLRHRLLRHLVERHGFSAYAMESGFAESRLADEFVRGGGRPIGQVLADGLTSLMGLWTEVRDQLEWLRQHNDTVARPVGFTGIDLPGSMVSLLPGLDFLARAGLTVEEELRETAASFASASAFSVTATMAAYRELPVAKRDALTAGLAELAAQLPVGDDEPALRALSSTIALDGLGRAMARGDMHEMMEVRDAFLADTVEWIASRSPRVVLVAHNGHIQRTPGMMPGLPPITTMGAHLADRLGDGYLVVGTTSGTGWTLNTTATFYEGELFAEQGPPEPDSLDGVLAASHDGAFAVDLRRLSPGDAATLATVTRQRFGPFYSEINPRQAYDAVVHLPHVTPASPDPEALACSPVEVREVFAKWQSLAPRP